jgi:hypothetical protein
MSYIIVNSLGINKIACSLEPIKGRNIYFGHKSKIEKDILSNVIMYYYDKSKSRFLFMDYLKWNKIYNLEDDGNKVLECLFPDSNATKGLETSYFSLLDLMKEKYGNFKKINFTEI